MLNTTSLKGGKNKREWKESSVAARQQRRGGERDDEIGRTEKRTARKVLEEQKAEGIKKWKTVQMQEDGEKREKIAPSD